VCAVCVELGENINIPCCRMHERREPTSYLSSHCTYVHTYIVRVRTTYVRTLQPAMQHAAHGKCERRATVSVPVVGRDIT
jgi:hypothetical protein